MRIFGHDDCNLYVRVSKTSNQNMKFEKCYLNDDDCQNIGEQFYTEDEIEALLNKAYSDIPRAIVLLGVVAVAFVEGGFAAEMIVSSSLVPIINAILFGFATAVINSVSIDFDKIITMTNPFEQWQQAKTLKIIKETNDVILDYSIKYFIYDLTIALTRPKALKIRP